MSKTVFRCEVGEENVRARWSHMHEREDDTYPDGMGKVIAESLCGMDKTHPLHALAVAVVETRDILVGGDQGLGKASEEFVAHARAYIQHREESIAKMNDDVRSGR